jgi:uncharacterized membrane protein
MSHLYLALKLVHVLGSAVLFGTGLGIAYFMWMANRTVDPFAIAHVSRIVVAADAIFIATAVVVQPLTGWVMMLLSGFSLFHWWIKATLALYVFVGLCWLPVVWIQLKMRDLAIDAVRDGKPLPARYHTLFRVWFILGWPAFVGVIAIFALMLWKPHW